MACPLSGFYVYNLHLFNSEQQALLKKIAQDQCGKTVISAVLPFERGIIYPHYWLISLRKCIG
jgi:hypothetical protein